VIWTAGNPRLGPLAGRKSWLPFLLRKFAATAGPPVLAIRRQRKKKESQNYPLPHEKRPVRKKDILTFHLPQLR